MSWNEAALSIAKSLPYLYTLLFVFSVGTTKHLSSVSIIVVILALAEFFSATLNTPLIRFIYDQDVEFVLRVGFWVILWSIFSFLVVLILQKCHEWTNTSKGKELRIVQGAYVISIVLHLLMFLNQMLIHMSILDRVYNFGIPFINFSIAGYLLLQVLSQGGLKWRQHA
ncbi:hypothetical protein [Alteromonas sp. a30]|uniref:hypothetical protein n=1 Tax=Alteromonas sp. a30 TaxID=2730917 RepID=UPI00227E79BF|nr:hypothetical protein [Alteromonas sp. a30]MCY7295834.1 hypothetical protein [Alteromonas sp. a30]